VSESVPGWDDPDDRPAPGPGDGRSPFDDGPSLDDPAADPSGDGAAPDALDRMREDARESREKSESRRSFWRELPLLVLVALVVAILIKTFLIQAFFIPSASMRDTLLEGDRVMVNKLAYRFGDPSRGDVIVFDSPLEPKDGGENLLGSVVRHVAESLGLSSPDSALIKRVIAIGGETIEIRDNRVLIDGDPIDEPYLKPGTRMPDFGPETVPEGELFVMGDNRGASQDSRRFGTVLEDTVIGRAFVRVWPPSRWGGL
jgi:signal peptidase I